MENSIAQVSERAIQSHEYNNFLTSKIPRRTHLPDGVQERGDYTLITYDYTVAADCNIRIGLIRIQRRFRRTFDHNQYEGEQQTEDKAADVREESHTAECRIERHRPHDDL